MQVPGGGLDGDADRTAAAKQGSRWGNVVLLLVSLLTTLLLIEIGYRVAAGLPLLKLANWRTDQVVKVNLGELKAIFDPVLGWTNKASNQHEDGYTTIEYGVRKNFDETTIRTGAMLAVGDSFTEGWEVKDHESWPAYLEKLTSAPVVNAGTGGYGADQTILRAEQMLPIVKPKILLVGFHEIAIVRAGYSIFGAPKPYFTLENGEPRYHPPKFVERLENKTLAWTIAYEIREALGYSAFADYLFARLNPNFWYGDGANDLYQKADVNEVAVTCALLKRLKAQTDRDGVRMMLVLQYYATNVLWSDRPGPHAQSVRACAEAMGIRVVDQFASLHAIVLSGPPNVIHEYYWYYDQTFGHMTAKGNAHAAGLIHAALRDWLPGTLGWSPQTRAAPGTAPTPDSAGTLQP
jgi:hypothetical protein